RECENASGAKKRFSSALADVIRLGQSLSSVPENRHFCNEPVVIHTDRTGRTSNAEEVHEAVFAHTGKSAVYQDSAFSGRYPSRTESLAHQPSLRCASLPDRHLVLFYPYALSDGRRSFLRYLV